MDITLRSILDNAESSWSSKPFIHTRNGPTFASKTFGEFAQDVRALSVALVERGFAGKHILIYGENSYEWMVADYAACAYVGVSAALSKDSKKRDLVSAIEKTDIAAVFYSQKLSGEIEGLSELLNVPFFSLESDLHRIITASKSDQRREQASAIPSLEPEDINALCKIYFTSGTTGIPKAAMLSQKNIFSGVESLVARAPMDERDCSYLFLPLSHTYGGIYNFIYSLIFGISLYLCSDTNLIAEELQIVRPTIFCAVPRILERFLCAANASENATQAGEILRQMFGGNLRYLFCSGSPWRPEDRLFYKNSGLNLLEAYALTETASSFSLSYSGESDTESVGVVFENIDVRIDADFQPAESAAMCGLEARAPSVFDESDYIRGQREVSSAQTPIGVTPGDSGCGEILVRGDNVFLGYYNDAQATAAAFDSSGFFRTGDIGRLDATRHLYITGRKSGLRKTSAGEFATAEDADSTGSSDSTADTGASWKAAL